MTAPPDAGLVARFRAGVEAALGRALIPEEPVALAVSGGPDSMAMLILSAAAFPGRTIAATMDHGLRGGSADEAAMVASYCHAIGVAHQVLTPARPIEPANVQAGARLARYAALADWAKRAGAAMIATAHHADDQAETFLMRAARGSGVAGLAGIRRRQPIAAFAAEPDESAAITVIRPLLDWRAAELRAVVVAAGVPFVDDPSNSDSRFTRTGFRALLQNTPLIDAAMLAQSAAHAAEADAAIDTVIGWLWEERSSHVPDRADVAIDMAGLPRELKRRLVRLAIERVRAAGRIAAPDFGEATNVEPLLDALEAGRTATQGGVIVSARDEVWRFLPAPPRRTL